jgi:hypothetical protein
MNICKKPQPLAICAELGRHSSVNLYASIPFSKDWLWNVNRKKPQRNLPCILRKLHAPPARRISLIPFPPSSSWVALSRPFIFSRQIRDSEVARVHQQWCWLLKAYGTDCVVPQHWFCYSF